jgi:hypothetical protein
MFRAIAIAAATASLFFAAPGWAQPAAPDAASAAASAWQAHDYADLGFSAVFPEDPKRVDMTMDMGKDATGAEQGPMSVSMFMAGAPEVRTYAVMRMDFSKSKLDADALHKQMDAAKEKFTGTVNQKGAKVTFTGGPGLEMIVQKPGELGRIRIYLAGKCMFIAMVLQKTGSVEALKDADADRFMGGFKLLN